jgi:chromosome segregation ATPase
LPLPGSVDSTPTEAAAADAAAAAGSSDGDLMATAEELDSLRAEDLRQRVLEAHSELRGWRSAIQEANEQIAGLYDETHRLHSLYQVTERDAKYLREVLVSALKSGELHATAPMLQGLSRMLHFTHSELERIQAHSRSSGVGGVVGSLAGWGFPGLTSPSPSAGSRLL